MDAWTIFKKASLKDKGRVIVFLSYYAPLLYLKRLAWDYISWFDKNIEK